MTQEHITVAQAPARWLRRAGAYTAGDQVPPCAILWTDPEGLWQGVLEDLKEFIPALFVYGPYAPEMRTGPALYLRCVEARTVAPHAPKDHIPVFYLPGVGRQQLREVEECPAELQPLVELQFRGTVWAHPNGKDWTPLAFLSSEHGGMGLEVARDAATLEALQRALPVLLREKVEDLQGQRLDADFLNRLLAPNLPSLLLGWTNDPESTKGRKSGEEWSAFCHQCVAEYGFHPQKDGALRAAEFLGRRGDKWSTVWRRFAEAPKRYPGVVMLLEQADRAELEFDPEPWPKKNDAAEKELADALRELKQKQPDQAGARILELEKAHGHRRRGHQEGWKLARLVAQELGDLASRVRGLIAAGWGEVVLVTDHGWLQGRVQFGGPLSGRDTTAVQKTMSGLLKLLYPNPESPIPDEALEWAVRLALECRRRVKEQQKRIGSAEFRNTHFSYQLGSDDVEKSVATPELYSEDTIGTDPLPPGQVWVIPPGAVEENPSLYRIDVTEGSGSGVRILNQPTPAAFRESVRCVEQNLYVQAKVLVGDREPREHEFSVQLRAFDASKGGAAVGMGVLLALCSALLQRSLKGGMAIAGGLNLGGAVEPVYNAVSVVEIAIEKGAVYVLMPVNPFPDGAHGTTACLSAGSRGVHQRQDARLDLCRKAGPCLDDSGQVGGRIPLHTFCTLRVCGGNRHNAQNRAGPAGVPSARYRATHWDVMVLP